MPHNHITKAFYFDELSKKGQEKALELNRDINVEFPNWDELNIEDAKEDLTALGYTDIKIAYSGFWSQGDGASFTAKVDICAWLKAHKLTNRYRALCAYVQAGNYVDFKVHRIDTHYSHEFTIGVEHNLEGGASNRVDDQAIALDGVILEDARKQSRKIYKDLESSYEGLTSDEAVKDTILANEYEFTESGHMI